LSEEAAVPRVGQKGTAFTATVDEPDPDNPGQYLVVDLTDADTDTCVIEFKRPNKTTFTKPAIVYGLPANGKLRFVDSTGVLDAVGDWYIRACAGFEDGSFYPGSWTLMEVGT